MFISKPIRNLILLWLLWAVILLGFQRLVSARIALARPDRVLSWTANETHASSHRNQPYLNDPVLNETVAWDSEFYLSIAAVGYDDPVVRTLQPPDHAAPASPEAAGFVPLSLNYAFFPFYPLMIRVVAFPLRLLGMTPIAISTVAGVIVSLLGALVAMLSLYDILHDELGDEGGLRAAFYLLIFPSGFYLAQVYTEGLFVGLAFGSLALIRRRQWVGAAVLAACATWTRAVGAALLIPLLIAWVQDGGGRAILQRFTWKTAGIGMLALSPLAAYLIWNVLLGRQFHEVEAHFFSRGLFDLSRSFSAWRYALSTLMEDNPQTAVYYWLEFASVALGLAACLLTLKDYPGIALFGLTVVVISFTSGVPQGMIRYVLAVPSIFILLSRLGRSPVFDRAWTTASLLIMGLLVTLYTFDLWVA